ncbi:zinc ribbon domain-containing protein [Asanoa sp. WMMD1127]|uniref:zinc ribbon domain-containing protein n=1 Tax=Asanoa sp. WMMD1127 TaxID=3016107 RepID=UPI002415B06A|nr:zinc ribbon domain-containing protein [Asanoa sp. WMMD1127]MDG4825476.1 zinc ribbon domain-containing protein [Asanoa sp. WMMD1127]
MATYVYRCSRDGDFEVRLPLGAATESISCGHCAGDATRVWSAPHLSRTPRPLAAAIEQAGRSAEAPRVVAQLPGARRVPAPVPRGLPRL